MMRELWPVIDAVLQRRLRRVGDEVRKTLATEVDKLAAQVPVRLVKSQPHRHSCLSCDSPLSVV